jgi:translocation and assembly module TamB
VIRATVITAVATLTLVLGGLWFVLGTTSGALRLIDFGSGWLPGELELAEADGSLSTVIQVGRLVYRQEDLSVVATNVVLDLDIRQLLKGTIAIESAILESLTLNDLPIDLRVQLTGAARLKTDFPLEASIEWSDGPTNVRGRGQFSGTLSQLDFKHVVELPEVVHIDGVVRDIVEAPSVAADVRWDELSLPEQEFGALVSRNGGANIKATLDEYRVTANAEFIRDDDQQLTAALAAHGDAASLVIDSLELEGGKGFGGTLGATGTIGFGDLPAVLLAVSGKDFDPGVLLPGYDGRLTFQADVDARWPERLIVRVPRLEGEFLGSPVQGAGELLAADGILQRADARLRSGSNTLQLSVSGQTPLAGDFEIDAPELASIWPGLVGAMRGSGKLGGTRAAPSITLDLSGTGVGYGEQRIARLRIAGWADAERGVDFKASAEGLELLGQPLGDLTVNGSGTFAAHTFEVRLSGGLLATRFDVAGSWDGDTLDARMSNATIDTDIGAWRLQETLAVKFGSGAINVSAHCWDNAPASICLEALESREDRLQAGAVLKRFPLQLLNPWLGEGVALEGDANATLSFARDTNGFNATVDWQQSDTRLIFESDLDAVLVDAELETRLSAVELSLVADQQTAVLTGSVVGAFGLTAGIEVRLEEPLENEGALRGALQAEVPDIGELHSLVDRYVSTEELVGELLIDIQLGGTRAAPTLDGGATLRNARATIPLFGITVADVAIAVSAGDNDNLIVEGSARSGEGVIDLAGVIGVSPETGVFADIGVKGERFQLLQLPDLTAFVSPDLTARFDQGVLELDGSVRVPEAVFAFRELGETAITTSDDVVIHREGEDSSEATVNSRLAGSLDFVLGDAVTFSGLGLETRLTGGLLMTFRPGAMPTGEGAFQLVDGTFETFGREMLIERGSLNFFGPLDDPVVDARATRRLRYEGQDIKLGIILAGRISQQLDFTLFSEPSMTESDILSFLVVGRPTTTGDDGAASGAALALGLQSLSATRRAGETLTLDEISFEGGGADDTSVVAGKQLGDRWFIRYSYGLFDRVGTFIIRYDIGRGVSIEAGSGGQQSLDLIYSIDR